MVSNGGGALTNGGSSTTNGGTSQNNGGTSTTNGGNGSSSGTTSSGGTSNQDCTDEPPPNGDTCEHAVEWGWCGQDWMFGACAQSCGLCSSQGNGGSSQGNGGSSQGNGGSSQGNGGSPTSGGATSGGANGAGGTPVIQDGCNGYATRFWDCCKPHCAWQENVPSGVNPMTTCDQSDSPLSGAADAPSSCDGGNAYTCHGLAPWAVSDQLAYGYAATSSGDVCGRCFQIQFTGSSHNAGNDPGSQALAGKTMIVQAINVGFDVSGGQFDLLIPGGGVGAFNACSNQWGVSTSELGAQYGGFLTSCKSSTGSSDLAALKSCVSSSCESVFGSRGLSELQAGCQWFADWFQAADNPSLVYKEVTCPSAITSKSGMDRTSRNDISNSCG